MGLYVKVNGGLLGRIAKCGDRSANTAVMDVFLSLGIPMYNRVGDGTSTIISAHGKIKCGGVTA